MIAYEISVAFNLSHVTVRLPKHIHSDQNACKITVFDVMLDFRDINQYVDIHVVTSPVCLLIATSDRNDSEFIKEYFPNINPAMTISDIALQMHFSRNFVSQTIFKMKHSIFISSIDGILLPKQVRSLMCSLNALMNQVHNYALFFQVYS